MDVAEHAGMDFCNNDAMPNFDFVNCGSYNNLFKVEPNGEDGDVSMSPCTVKTEPVLADQAEDVSGNHDIFVKDEVSLDSYKHEQLYNPDNVTDTVSMSPCTVKTEPVLADQADDISGNHDIFVKDEISLDSYNCEQLYNPENVTDMEIQAVELPQCSIQHSYYASFNSAEIPHQSNIHDKSSLTMKSLSSDTLMIEQNEPSQYDIHGKMLLQMNSLQNCMFTESGENTFSRDTCDGSEKNALMWHMQAHSREKSFCCNTCEKLSFHMSTSQKHMSIYSQERPFYCNTERLFSQKNDIHIHTYNKEKPFRCDACNKSFPCKSKLQRHLRTHNGTKSYRCDTCEKSFSQRNRLQFHMRTHNRETFRCDICEKSFSPKSRFQYHMRTHSGEKPFLCDACGKSFSHKSILQRHMQTHIKEKPFICPICNKSFSTSRYLNEHVRSQSRQ